MIGSMNKCSQDSPLIKATDISITRNGKCILKNVDICVNSGQIVALIGPNGAGKSTFVKALLGLTQLNSGKVWQKPKLIVGYVPQKIHLANHIPLNVKRFLKLASASDAAIEAVLSEVGLPGVLKQPMQSLSGGELQRVLLARALLHEPELLVLDEPVQGVDIAGRIEVYQLISDICKARGCGVLMVSHDLHIVMANTDEVICLNHHICCSGHPESVAQHPEYLSLFGPAVAHHLAVYQHHHDHQHTVSGDVQEGD